MKLRLFVALLGVITVGQAAPLLYNFNFFPTQGATPSGGSFVYDTASPLFLDFSVNYLGVTFDLTNLANSSTTNGCYRPNGNHALEAFSWLTGDESTSCGLGVDPSDFSYFITLANGYRQMVIDSRRNGNFVFYAAYSGDARDVNGIGGAGRLSVSLATPEATPEPSTGVCLAGGMLGLMLLKRRLRF